MELRTIDYIGIAAFLLLQIILVTTLSLSIGEFIGVFFLEILTGVAIKLFNMYRMEPRERVEKKREGGLSGLFC